MKYFHYQFVAVQICLSKRLKLSCDYIFKMICMNGNFKDGLNFASKLTPKRIWNGLKVVLSFYNSKITNKPTQWGLPFSISFEPTTSCNLRCPECPSGLRSFTRPTGMLEGDLFKRTIDELSDTLLYLIFYFQGEPYLHPQFLELVGYASRKGIYTANSVLFVGFLGCSVNQNYQSV